MADVPAIRITAVDQATKVIDQVKGSLGNLAASVLSVTAVIGTLKSALAFGDELQTTSERLGISVGKLQELSAVAAQSGTSLEGMGKAYKGLAQSMAAAQAAGSEQAKVFKALGVSTKDAAGNLKDFATITPELSDSLNAISDETLRLAVGVKLFGKSYTESAAAIRTFRDAQKEANDMIAVFGTVTPTAAAAADQLGDRLKLLWEGTKASVLTNMTTGFATLSAAMKELYPFIGQVADGFGKFINWIAEVAGPVMIRWATTIQAVGYTMAAVVAAWGSDFLKAQKIFKELGNDLDELAKKREASLARLQIAQAGAAAGAAGIIQPDEQTKSVAETNRQYTALARLRESMAGAITKEKDALDGLEQSLLKQTIASQKLNAVDTLTVELNQAKLGALTKEREARIANLYAYARQIDAAKKLEEAQKTEYDLEMERIKAALSSEDAMRKATQSAEEYVSKLELEVAAMTLSNAEREKSIALFELEQKGISKTSAEYQAFAERISKALDTKAQLQGQIDLWKGIENAAHDAFMHIWESGKSVWERLTQSLKSTLLELLYSMTVKRWIVNIAASVTGTAASNAIAGSVGGGGGLGGGLFESAAESLGFKALFSTFTTGLQDAAFAMGSWTGETLLAAGASTDFAASMAGMAAQLGPLGVAGLVAAAGYMIYQYFKGKEGGPKTGGFATSGPTPGIRDTDNSGFRWMTPSDLDPQFQTSVKSIQDSYDQLLRALHGRGTATFAQGGDMDPKGTAPSNVHTGAWINGVQIVDIKNPNVGRTTEEFQAEITLQAERALIAALKASDLPPLLAKLFNSVDATTITLAAAQDLITFAEAVGSLSDIFNRSPIDDALNAVKDAAGGAEAALRKQGDTLQEMVDTYDGTTAATTNLSTATAAYYTNVVALIAQIEQLKTAISDMFKSSIQTYTFAKLDTQGQYEYLMKDAADLQKQLQQATDATTVNRLAQQINAEQQQAFGMLTPEQQKAAADDFIARANQINDLAQKKLQDAEDAAQARLNGILTAIKSALDQAIGNFNVGAAAVQNGGEAIERAAAVQDQRQLVNA